MHIIDENDNAPRFSQTLYLRSVSESSMSGTEVEVVMATDSDIDAVISYSLVDSFNKFGIDSMVSVRMFIPKCAFIITIPLWMELSQ